MLSSFNYFGHFDNNSSALMKLESIKYASTAGASGDVLLFLSSLSLSIIFLSKIATYTFRHFHARRMFFSNNLLALLYRCINKKFKISIWKNFCTNISTIEDTARKFCFVIVYKFFCFN